MGRGRQADGLDEVAHGVRPRRAQLQQRDVVVVVPAVVVLMDYDPPHCGHKLGTALHLHAQVGTPCSGVSQPGWEQRRLFLKKYLKTPADSRSGERGAQHLHNSSNSGTQRHLWILAMFGIELEGRLLTCSLESSGLQTPAILWISLMLHSKQLPQNEG